MHLRVVDCARHRLPRARVTYYMQGRRLRATLAPTCSTPLRSEAIASTTPSASTSQTSDMPRGRWRTDVRDNNTTPNERLRYALYRIICDMVHMTAHIMIPIAFAVLRCCNSRTRHAEDAIAWTMDPWTLMRGGVQLFDDDRLRFGYQACVQSQGSWCGFAQCWRDTWDTHMALQDALAWVGDQTTWESIMLCAHGAMRSDSINVQVMREHWACIVEAGVGRARRASVKRVAPCGRGWLAGVCDVAQATTWEANAKMRCEASVVCRACTYMLYLR